MKRLLHIAILLLAGALSMLAQEIDFINNEVNHIIMNGDDWSDMRRSLKNPKSWGGGKWQVVQIGDSHIQP